MADKITLRGAEELKKIFKQLGPRIEKNALKAGLRAGGRVIVKDAKSRINVSSEGAKGNVALPSRNHSPGTLRRSIGIRSPRGKRNEIKLQVLPRSGEKEKNDGWYAHFVEFGTIYQNPKPFLRPAFHSNKLKVVTGLGKKIGEYLDKISKK